MISAILRSTRQSDPQPLNRELVFRMICGNEHSGPKAGAAQGPFYGDNWVRSGRGCSHTRANLSRTG